MDDWMLSPTFSSSSPPSLEDSALSSDACNMLKKLLGSPPTFIHEHASWSWTSIVPCETAPPGNRVGSIAEIKMLQQNPYLGLVLGECHFSLNDNNGALEWCRKAKALLSDEDPGLQTAIDFLKKSPPLRWTPKMRM